MWKWFHRFGSPPHFYRLAGWWTPWLAWAAALAIAIGLYGGLVMAPADDEMGEGFRIIYVHVPSAWLSLMAYVTMAVAAGIGLIWRMKLAHAVAASCAFVGASFTFLALVTGSIWGKPMWGTWWAWDARLTSELLLLFLFLGYMALRQAFDDVTQADRASAVLALVGVINVPIIHYSVEWWHSLHQPSTVVKAGGPAIAASMLWPLLVCALGFTLYFMAVLMVRVRAEVLRREGRKAWVRELVLPGDTGSDRRNLDGGGASKVRSLAGSPS